MSFFFVGNRIILGGKNPPPKKVLNSQKKKEIFGSKNFLKNTGFGGTACGLLNHGSTTLMYYASRRRFLKNFQLKKTPTTEIKLFFWKYFLTEIIKQNRSSSLYVFVMHYSHSWIFSKFRQLQIEFQRKRLLLRR